jgi:2-dehydropantoate 2-reductase
MGQARPIIQSGPGEGGEGQVMKKVCIVGAGAIGGLIGTKLAAAGRAEVSALARGATLAALQQQGWRLKTAAGLVQAPARAAGQAAELGPQDLVVIAVKGPALTQVARGIAPLLAPHTVVLPAMNGVPWWFCQGVAGFPGGPLVSVDPGGAIATTIPFEQVLGCVVHASASTPEPGLVQHQMGQGLIVGEPRGGASERAQAAVDLLAQAGFEVKLADNVRYDIWYKLWGNMTMNPVSALTGATIDRVLGDPLVREFCSAAMQEAAAIGERIGCAIAQSPEDRHAVTARLGAFKTSMLQDVEAGRPIELDAIVGAVHEIGQRLGLATPKVAALLGLARLFARMRGLYPQEERR